MNTEAFGKLAASAYLATKNKYAAIQLMKNNWEGVADWVYEALWEAIDSYEDRKDIAEILKFKGLQNSEGQ